MNDDAAIAAAQWFTDVILQLAYALLIGRLVMDGVMGAAPLGWRETVRPRQSRIASRALLILVVAQIATLWLEAAVMLDVPLTQVGESVLLVLTDSRFGVLWIASFCGTVLLALAETLQAPTHSAVDRTTQSAAFWLRVVGCLDIALMHAASGHSGARALTAWPVAADTLHILGAASWVGMVAIASLVLTDTHVGVPLQRARDASDVLDARARVAAQLSRAAVTALLVLMVAGLANAVARLGAWANLTATGYGTTLCIKLGGVALALACAATNRFWVLPRLASSHTSDRRRAAWSRFIMMLRIECAALVATVGAAEVLAMTAPPVMP